MDTKYLISIDDGRLVFRNEYTDLQANLKPVPDELVEMLVKGEVAVEDVLLAVGRRERENGFDLHKYVEDRKKLNVRTSDPQQAAPKQELRDRTEETVTVDEVVSAKKTATKAERKAEKPAAKAEKPAADSAVDDVFSS